MADITFLKDHWIEKSVNFYRKKVQFIKKTICKIEQKRCVYMTLIRFRNI